MCDRLRKMQEGSLLTELPKNGHTSDRAMYVKEQFTCWLDPGFWYVDQGNNLYYLSDVIDYIAFTTLEIEEYGVEGVRYISWTTQQSRGWKKLEDQENIAEQAEELRIKREESHRRQVSGLKRGYN